MTKQENNECNESLSLDNRHDEKKKSSAVNYCKQNAAKSDQAEERKTWPWREI